MVSSQPGARGVVIAAPSSGAGKTLLTLGLLRAFARSGVRVASAKVGPDYIDPRFHEAASGRAALNLDNWAMRTGLVRELACMAAADADFLVAEGVMGLFDGAATGEGSTADFAATLGLPVILIVDAHAQAQSAAAVVKGFAEFRDDCDVAGVIFNRVGSASHAAILREAIAPLGIDVVGAVPSVAEIDMPSRHLGLVQAEEHRELDALLERAGDMVASGVDLEAVMGVARKMPAAATRQKRLPPLGQTIAIAQDEAFAFAYPHLLSHWRQAGAEIIPFSPLANEAPAGGADAVYLPGGYPELHAGRLAGNEVFRAGLRDAAKANALVYGECGGFMTLGEYLIDAQGNRHTMAGLLPLGTSFADRQLHLGYRRLVQDDALPWPGELRGHEFHYSRLDWQGEAEPLFEAEDARGEKLGQIGLRRDNVMGSYAHIIDMEEAA